MIDRYTLPEMGALWSEQNKFQKWLDVEIAVCEVHAEMGTIPRDALEQIKARAKFSVRAHQRDREDDQSRRHRVHDKSRGIDRRSKSLRSLRSDFVRRRRHCQRAAAARLRRHPAEEGRRVDGGVEASRV